MKIENIEKLCNENNIKFAYVGTTTALIKFNEKLPELLIDMKDNESINNAHYKIKLFLSN